MSATNPLVRRRPPSAAASGQNLDSGGGFRQRRGAFTTRRALVIFGFLAPAFLFIGVFTYYPVLVGIQMPFRRWEISNLSDNPWVGLDNFVAILTDSSFITILLNTVLWVFASLIPQFLIGFAIASWLRRKFPFRGLYQALIFYPWAVSGFLIGVLFRWMFNGEFGVINDLLIKVGFIDSGIGWLANPATGMVAVIVTNIWYGVPFFAIMILAAMQSVPDELLEAAALDGASKARTMLQVIVPYISTTLALAVLLRVIWIFNFPDIIWAMTGGGPADQTQIITTWMITFVGRGKYGLSSALGILVMIMLLIFTAIYLAALRPRKENNQ